MHARQIRGRGAHHASLGLHSKNVVLVPGSSQKPLAAMGVVTPSAQKPPKGHSMHTLPSLHVLRTKPSSLLHSTTTGNWVHADNRPLLVSTARNTMVANASGVNPAPRPVATTVMVAAHCIVGME